MDELFRFPAAGVARDDIAPGLRALQTGQHLISYRLHGEAVVIIRLLHERMDASTALEL